MRMTERNSDNSIDKVMHTKRNDWLFVSRMTKVKE